MRPFEEIVDQHGDAVLGVIRSYVSPADADDVWSETFLAALRAYPRLRPESNVRGWLVTIARRKVIDHVRASRSAPVDPADLTDTISADGVPDPADDDLRAALRTLTSRQRDAVIYHHVAGLPYAEVGELLGSSEAAARRSAADGISKLRTAYPGGAR